MNLSVAGIAQVAIALSLANKKRFSNLGFIQALRSPQLAGLISEMNPKSAREDGRLSIDTTQAVPVATVKLNYRPQEQATIKTTRTVATGSAPSEGTTLDVVYNTHRELDLTYRTVDLMRLTKQAEDYLKKADAGILQVNTADFALLSDMGDQIVRKADSVLTNMDTAVGTAVIAGAGGNLMIGAVSPANVAVPNVKAFNADGSMHLDFFDWLQNLRVVHAFEGTPIVVGGQKMLTWMTRKGVASAASLGFDYAKAYAELDIEFYYDAQVDTLSGADHIIVIDPGAACLETILEHELIENGGVLAAKKVANTTYGTMSLNVAQTNAPTFSLDMDFRVREEDTAYPRYTITPSAHFGVFTRPAGYHKNYGGWETHTGIFRAKLVNAA
ncbi:hypothetical protein A6C57_23480 [Fibrella sp. ES10-3-2-2]|nr:hypothetical protein A6C57_23480 [Fibrella sp. ES10-3-2-2]